MKVYDYECMACGRVHEVFTNHTDEWLPCHTEGCGELMFKRLAAPHGVVRGRADGKDKYAGADAFTKEALGIKGDLPKALRADKGKHE